MENQMTNEQLEQEILEHEDITAGMEKACDEMAKKLGRNNSVVVKMRQINDIFKSFTRQEIIDLISMEDEEDESEGSPVQEES